MRQLTFSWPHSASYTQDDYIVSTNNAEAAARLESWPSAVDTRCMLLVGPPGSGKTHLARRWAQQQKAWIIDNTRLGQVESSVIWPAHHPLGLLEDIDRLHNDEGLFHLLRHLENHHLTALFTSRHPLESLSFALPDVQSRLRALHTLHIAEPDEALLQIFLSKLFSDMQLTIDDSLIHYILSRIPRTFGAAQTFAQQLHDVVATHKKIDREQLRYLLEKLE